MSETTGSVHPGGARREITPWRVGRWWRKYQWLVIGGAWLAVGTLGYVGFARHFAALGESRSPGTLLYLTIQLFVLESGAVAGPVGWELEVARFLAPAVAAYTAVVALALLFYERFQILRLRFAREHIVICGLGRKGLLLARGFRERGDRVVVIEVDEENDLIDQCRELGVTVLIGDAASQEFLSLARVRRARVLFAVSGDDGANAEVAVRAHEHVANRPGQALTCIVHIVDPQLCDLLREQELAASNVGRFRLEFFNVFDTGARAVLIQYPPFDHLAGRNPRLLIAGLGQMGESLVVHAARSWWARYTATGERLHMSIIDRYAAEKVESLALRYPQLQTACELVPLTMEIRSPDFERGEYLHAADGTCDVTVSYVCLDDDTASLSTGLALRQKIGDARIPIVVRVRHDAGLATLLGGSYGDDRGFEGLYAFGLLDRTCTPELVLGGSHEVLARAIHDRHLQIQREKGITVKQDQSLVPWERLPAGLQESYRRKADHIGIKLREVGCTVAPLTDWEAGLFQFEAHEIEIMGRMEQERRIEERRTHARVADLNASTDPELVAWEQLSEAGRQSCLDAVTDLPMFLARAGFQVRRTP